MFAHKLLAAVGISSALLVGAASEASANPWRGPHYLPAPVYRAPVYRAPVYPAPVYRAPVFVPVYRGPVWGHHHWGHRF